MRKPAMPYSARKGEAPRENPADALRERCTQVKSSAIHEEIMMLKRAALFALPLLLTACQSTQAPPPAPAPQAQQPRGVSITPSNFKLPEGSGCSGDVARFRAIQANDLETGHTTKSVYDQIEAEMKKADAMCASGNAGAASAHVRATKSRFGYP